MDRANGRCLGEMAIHSNRWGVGTRIQLNTRGEPEEQTLRGYINDAYIIRLGIVMRWPPFIEPAIGCLEAAGAESRNKQSALPRRHDQLGACLLRGRTREDEVFHWEVFVTNGGYAEAIAVRIPVKRSDGISVAVNLNQPVSMTYCRRTS